MGIEPTSEDWEGGGASLTPEEASGFALRVGQLAARPILRSFEPPCRRRTSATAAVSTGADPALTDWANLWRTYGAPRLSALESAFLNSVTSIFFRLTFGQVPGGNEPVPFRRCAGPRQEPTVMLYPDYRRENEIHARSSRRQAHSFSP